MVPGDKKLPTLGWWKRAVIYQIYPASFADQETSRSVVCRVAQADFRNELLVAVLAAFLQECFSSLSPITAINRRSWCYPREH